MKQRILLAVIILSVLLLWTLPAVAANNMTVTPVWRPGQQLTTLVSDNDFRYVDVELTVTGNVQFWAVNVACAFTPAVLQGYNVDTTLSTLDLGDDIPMVTWGPDWGVEGADFFTASVGTDPDGGGPLEPPDGFDFNAATGTLTLRATRLGSVAPLGVNGANYSMLLATLRLRVRDLGTAVLTNSATVKCTPMDFLDRDGRVVVKGKQAKTPALAVRTGYSISGQALLQGGKNHAGIDITCENVDSGADYTATSVSNGNYSFGGSGQLIRETGFYECVYESPIVSPKSEFLDAQIDLNLTTSTLFLLPVVLNGGNMDTTTGGSENGIDFNDLIAFTTEWLPNSSTAAPYDSADVNGDLLENASDLAVIAGNYGVSDVDGSHVLYGLATDYGGTFPNSRVYWGDSLAGTVQRLEEPKADRDFWPNMSPDGSRVAFSRLVSKTGKYVLYTSPTAKPKGAQLTPKSGFNDDALAPAWSPDGQRVAFICSQKGQTSGYEFNEGNLCIIDATGANVQQIAVDAKVYPPAWFDNNVIIFAGQADHPTVGCQRNLCFIDLATGASGTVSGTLLGDGNDVADMPGISSYPDTVPDPDTEVKVLFYRFDDGSTNSLRARTVSYAGGVFTLGAVITVATPAGGNDIDFYNVSPTMDVMYYESIVTSGVFSTLDTFINRDFTLNGALDAGDWAAVETHNVDGFVGNITVTGGSIPGSAWNGDTGIPTPYHAQRASFDWIP